MQTRNVGRRLCIQEMQIRKVEIKPVKGVPEVVAGRRSSKENSETETWSPVVVRRRKAATETEKWSPDVGGTQRDRNVEWSSSPIAFASEWSSSPIAFASDCKTILAQKDDLQRTELRSNMQNLAKSSGGITKALQAFRLMKPTVYDYNSLVNCYLKSENVCLHDLSALYTEMNTLGLYPNASTFNTFLKGLNLLGESKNALWVTTEMCNYAFTPSFTSLSNLLKKCSDSMDLEEAITVLDLMMRLFKEASNCLNKMATDACYYPTVRTYTTVIKCLCDNGRIQEALSLLSQMEKRGLNPDIVTYNIILRALSNQNMVDEIFDLFQTIYQKDIPPDCYTATALSGLLKKGNLVIARSLLRDIVTCASDIDVAVYNVDLYCLISCFKFKEVSSLIKRMRKKGIEPNNITFNTILKGFCESKPMDEALEYFKSLKNPDLVSFNTILSTACKKGDIQMVKMVIDLMGNEGFELNVVGFTCLMVYYCNVGEINDCLDVFEHMISCGPTPSMVTINALMFGLCKNGELEAAYCTFRLKVFPILVKRHHLIGGWRSFSLKLLNTPHCWWVHPRTKIHNLNDEVDELAGWRSEISTHPVLS
ncbi:hypothetical protein LXL04_007572 [Taraxacum kok-saghyz]